ncbi:MAG: hypothetical protein HY698_12835 [Deltaproteobacteria bacterium]|nr:hypothetical protein [Deltaproteobacteria bacterium]
MAPEIDDTLVTHVARRLQGSRTPGAASGASAERLLREQPEVLAFVLAGTAQLNAESRAVGVFLGDVIFESFRLAGRDPRALRTTAFVTALRENREMALRVGQAHDRFAERYLKHSNTLRQPALIRYVTGLLLEPEEASRHEIPRDDLGPLFIVLKSVIDVLDTDSTTGLEVGA